MVTTRDEPWASRAAEHLATAGGGWNAWEDAATSAGAAKFDHALSLKFPNADPWTAELGALARAYDMRIDAVPLAQAEGGPDGRRVELIGSAPPCVRVLRRDADAAALVRCALARVAKHLVDLPAVAACQPRLVAPRAGRTEMGTSIVFEARAHRASNGPSCGDACVRALAQRLERLMVRAPW